MKYPKLTDDRKWIIYDVVAGLIVIAIASILLYLGSLEAINQANQVSVIYSKPFVEKVGSDEYLITVEVAVASSYADHIYVIPFLANSSSTDPALSFQGGFINEVFISNDVGYVNVTGQNVVMKAVHDEPIYDKKDVWFPSVRLTAFIFVVPEGSVFNVTFVANRSYVPTIWIAEPPPTSIGGFYTPIGIVVPLNGTPYYITP